jgi:hypothetical protein
LKIIYSKSERVTNKATSVTASSENASYPASNLLLGQVSKVFRSESAAAPISTITLTIVVPAGVNNAIGLFGCNATNMTVAVKDVTEATTYFTETSDLTPASTARTWNRVWKEWTSNGYALHIVVTLTAPTTATYHEVGEIVVGECISLPDPLYGLSESQDNYQIVQQLAGGGEYVHDGEIVRAFDLDFIMDRDTEYYDLRECYKTMGRKPCAMLLSEIDGDLEWCGYFKMNSAPAASHSQPTHSPVTLSIREAI